MQNIGIKKTTKKHTQNVLVVVVVVRDKKGLKPPYVSHNFIRLLVWHKGKEKVVT